MLLYPCDNLRKGMMRTIEEVGRKFTTKNRNDEQHMPNYHDLAEEEEGKIKHS